MKYRCISDIGGVRVLHVGKVYDVEEEKEHGQTVYTITIGNHKVFLSEETLPLYFEKVK